MATLGQYSLTKLCYLCLCCRRGKGFLDKKMKDFVALRKRNPYGREGPVTPFFGPQWTANITNACQARLKTTSYKYYYPSGWCRWHWGKNHKDGNERGEQIQRVAWFCPFPPPYPVSLIHTVEAERMFPSTLLTDGSMPYKGKPPAWSAKELFLVVVVTLS